MAGSCKAACRFRGRGAVEAPGEMEKAAVESRRHRELMGPPVVWDAPEKFQDWLAEYGKPLARVNLAEGVALARERRETMKRLIETDPEAALHGGFARESGWVAGRDCFHARGAGFQCGGV